MTEHRAIMAALMRMHLQTSRDETFVHLDADLESARSGRVRIGGESG